MPFLFIDDSYVKVPSAELWESHGLPNISSVQAIGNKNPAEAWFQQAVSQRDGRQSGLAQVKLKASLSARDVMSSPVVSLREGHTIQDALALIARNNFRHMPVLSQGDVLIGIVSERDILKRMCSQPNLSWGDFYKTPIVSVMISTVLTVTDDTDVREVAYLMACKGIGSLPVIHQENQGGRPSLVGIITKSDLYLLVIDSVVVDERIK